MKINRKKNNQKEKKGKKLNFFKKTIGKKRKLESKYFFLKKKVKIRFLDKNGLCVSVCKVS